MAKKIPSYRRHSSGQARVTLNGKDYLLGPWDSPESKAEYARLIAEYSTAGECFGKQPKSLNMASVLVEYLDHAEKYYSKSTEFENLKLALKPVNELYLETSAAAFGSTQFKACRKWWLQDKKRTRQYVNKQMKRLLRFIKWAVGEGYLPTDSHQACQCIAPLKRGRCDAPESEPVTCVDLKLVESTIEHSTKVLADMIRFQLLTGCRPGEICSIKPSMVDRAGNVWEIRLETHKTAYRGKSRTIYVGPRAQVILRLYLLRDHGSYCFSPIESEQQRREAAHARRKTRMSCGNRPGTNVARKPRKKPSDHYTTSSYARAITYACLRANPYPKGSTNEQKEKHRETYCWSPNQLRHSRATEIRKQFDLQAASVILGHSDLRVTQVYAEEDREKAIRIAKEVG